MKLLLCLACNYIFVPEQYHIKVCSCVNVFGVLTTATNKVLAFAHDKKDARVIGINNRFLYHDACYGEFPDGTFFNTHHSHIVRQKIDSKEAKGCGVSVAKNIEELRLQLANNIMNEMI